MHVNESQRCRRHDNSGCAGGQDEDPAVASSNEQTSSDAGPILSHGPCSGQATGIIQALLLPSWGPEMDEILNYVCFVPFLATCCFPFFSSWNPFLPASLHAHKILREYYNIYVYMLSFSVSRS